MLGSGPHVIRGVERYRGRLIAYSLGNFVGYHALAGGGVLDDSAILRATLVPGGRVLAARWIPIALVGGLLRPDPTGTSTKLVGALSAQDFPTDHWNIRSECVPDPDHHPLTVWLVQRRCSSPAEDISGCLDLPRSSPSEAVVTGRLCFASSRLPLICAVSTSQAASG